MPHVGFECSLTNSRSGSRRLLRSAMREIVVDSPPGRINASQAESCSEVRMGRKSNVVFEEKG